MTILLLITESRPLRLRIDRPLQSEIANAHSPPSPQTPDTTNNNNNHDVVLYRERANAPSRRNQDSFFSLLFERPARRRAYRRFNQNASNLVRRLSQSRLFLNSSRAQRNQQRESDATAAATPADTSVPPTPTSPTLAELEIGDLRHAHSLPSIDRDSDVEPTAPLAEEDTASLQNTTARPETPPPAYKDILPGFHFSQRSLTSRHSF